MKSSIRNIELKSKFFGKQLLNWWSKNRRYFSWRDSSDKYELLIAELLLRRTNATAAHVVYIDFLKEYPDLSSFKAGKNDEIEKLVLRLGLNWRAKNVVELAQYFECTQNSIPDTLESLTALPGVGPYVARAVLVNCNNFSSVPVDSNVVRVLCRFLGLEQNDSLRRNKQFQKLADSFVDKFPARAFNYALLDFSAAICRPRLPKCSICPVASVCMSSKIFLRERKSDSKI